MDVMGLVGDEGGVSCVKVRFNFVPALAPSEVLALLPAGRRESSRAATNHFSHVYRSPVTSKSGQAIEKVRWP